MLCSGRRRLASRLRGCFVDKANESPANGILYVTETPVDFNASCEDTPLRRVTKVSVAEIAKTMRRRGRLCDDAPEDKP